MDPRLESEGEGALVPQRVEAAALTQITKGEVDMQVSTAHAYPRDIAKFRNEARSLALATPEIAESCYFMIPRAGKQIEGPSIRLAEIVAGAWGNLRAETRIIDESHRWVTAQALCWDLEKNVAIRTEVRRRITDKHGRRFSDDMIGTTANAAASIALRNAIQRVVPRAYIDEICEECKLAAKGDIATLAERRSKAIEHFAKFGVVLEQVLTALEKPSVDAVDLDDVVKLRGWATAIQESPGAIDEIFPPVETKAGKETKGVAGLKAALAAKKAEKDQPDEKPKPAQSVFDELFALASERGVPLVALEEVCLSEFGVKIDKLDADQIETMMATVQTMQGEL